MSITFVPGVALNPLVAISEKPRETADLLDLGQTADMFEFFQVSSHSSSTGDFRVMNWGVRRLSIEQNMTGPYSEGERVAGTYLEEEDEHSRTGPAHCGFG
jgi:hypothetical protein